MSIQNNLPDFAGLFGNIDFKQGDDSRSVYSPAAYLTDLLQMLDDEFVDEAGEDSVDFHKRRDDIKAILLDEENTTTLIPYLDIVNEVLEKKAKPDTASGDAYSAMRTANFPMNMPFSLDNEKIKNHLNHLGISAHELQRLFAKEVDYNTIAREYLGLSVEEQESFIEPSTPITEEKVKSAYGYQGDAFDRDMSLLSNFMESTDLSPEAVRELLYQNLYVDPANHVKVEKGQEGFYINQNLKDSNGTEKPGYVTLSDDETKLEAFIITYEDDEQRITNKLATIPLHWFDRVNRFVRLAQKTGLGFTELDHILTYCCQVDGSPTIDSETILRIAQIVYFHKSLKQPIETIIAILSTISYSGRGNDELPQDQFNRIFNLPCVKVDKKYLHIDKVTGVVPTQYESTTYHDYTKVDYHPDLFSEKNDSYRKRLRHTLGFTTTDLINITNRLKHKKVVDSTLWEKKENEWSLLNLLYRIHALATCLDVRYQELFLMFDLLEQDPYVGRFDPHNYFIYKQPTTQNSFEIFVGDKIDDQLWLFESLTALDKWMKEFGYSAQILWRIVNNAPQTDNEEAAREKSDLAIYNALLAGVESQRLSPETFQNALQDERAALFAYSLSEDRSGGYTSGLNPLMTYTPMESQDLANDFIAQLEQISEYEFADLPIADKLQEKIIRNLVNHQVIDGNCNIITKGKDTDDAFEADQFTLEYDFSALKDDLYALFHNIYREQKEIGMEDIEIQVFKSDLKKLGLEAAEAKELYDTLIFNGYIDENGYAQDLDQFCETCPETPMVLDAGLHELGEYVYHHITTQVNKFKANRLMISERLFTELELKPVALKDLMTNLRMNGYIDENNLLIDPLRIIEETPETINLDLQFYPQRQAIYDLLQETIAENKKNYLMVDKAELSEIAAITVSRWIHEDLQSDLLHGDHIRARTFAGDFFLNEENRENFRLRHYFDSAMNITVFDRIATIIKYADRYKLTDQPLRALGFDESETENLKIALQNMDVLTTSGLLIAEEFPFFLPPQNAANFSVPGFEDYDKEIFFLLYDIAQNIENTLESIDIAMKQQSETQENITLEQLQAIFGIDKEAVKSLSKALFQTKENLHLAWIKPLLESANILNRLDELPNNMHYNQTVKRFGQLALLIKKLQLNRQEIAILLQDQNPVAKFPEDLTLPKGITRIDALLETEEFVYIFHEDDYWIYLASDYSMIDKKTVTPGVDDDLIERQKEDEALQKRLKEDPIRQLFDKTNLTKIDAAFIDQYGTWCVISGTFHHVKYSDSDVWDKRENHFGQVDNEFDNLEMIDSAYVDQEGNLFLFSNDKYVRYSNVNFTLDGQNDRTQPVVDAGYPKSIAESWNEENQPIQLPETINRDLGPMIDGSDNISYAFVGNMFVSSEDGQIHGVNEKWGHSEYNFGPVTHIEAAMESNGDYLLFSDDKVVKYTGSIELSNLRPEEGYPKPIHEEFDSLPDKFASGIDAALHGKDDKIYLFHDDEFVTIDSNSTGEAEKNDKKWGVVTNEIATDGRVDAAFVGLDGRTYIFSGDRYVRYSGSDYSEVDDGFPRAIAEDWEGLTQVTAAFVLDNKTWLFGKNAENEAIYVRYSTLHAAEGDYLEMDKKDPNARSTETVLANRPDVDEIEVFPATVNDDFWSLPESVTEGREDFQIDAVMNGPDDKVYLFYGNQYIEHDHANRWWSEPKNMSEQWDRVPEGTDQVTAAFTGKDGKTYLFYEKKYLRFSDDQLQKLDNGYPRTTNKYWGNVRNMIEKTGKVDATLVVESRWEEQNREGILVDRVEPHTYLFSGDQFYRYQGSDYSAVEPGYPRSINRLKEEPRFRGLEASFPNGLDAAFADQRQIYLFKDDIFHVSIGDKKSYREYEHKHLENIAAVTQENGMVYLLGNEEKASWNKLNHPEAPTLKKTEAKPRIAEKAETALQAPISAILQANDGNSYAFAGTKYYDTSLELCFNTGEVWGRSRNPIYDQETIDAAFVGRDGTTYLFSGEWFVQYDSPDYIGQNIVHPPRRISEQWHGLTNVALAYVRKEETYLFERPDSEGYFRFLRYSNDSYEHPDAGYPQIANNDFWQIPTEYQNEGFDHVDTIFVQNDNLIFINDRKFIRFNLKQKSWSYPQPLEQIYSDIPFNKTDFQDLKSGFVGADGKVYFFNERSYVCYDNQSEQWSAIRDIKDDWGLQTNIFDNGVDATYVSPDGTTYLFAGQEYVRYSAVDQSACDYRYIDENYPKKIATYLREEPPFAFMPKEFQQHLDAMEANDQSHFFTGIVDSGRSLYFFSQDRLFTGSPNRHVSYEIEGLGQIDNNFTLGGAVDAAFVDVDKEQTYLFSGEQYIRYTGDDYRYMDQGYPKIIAESLAADLGIDTLPEEYRDGIDAACHLGGLGTVFFNERKYLSIQSGNKRAGEIKDVWGKIKNSFHSGKDQGITIDGAYVDEQGALYLFKKEQFVRYSDSQTLLELNPNHEARYVDNEYPQNITEQWPQLDRGILTDDGAGSVFRFEDKIYFHSNGDFVTYAPDLSDREQEMPVQVLAYRWGKWSDFLLSDVHAISRFKDLGQRFTGGDLTLAEFVDGTQGAIKEPYMHFAAIFGFEKEEVRWIKQRNAFLPGKVNVMEEEFDIELVLRLYDILSTGQRLRVNLSPLYNELWLNLYGPVANYEAATNGAYNLLTQVDCDSNYEVLTKQITNELNTIKRDALVPYVIANDETIHTARDLYQQLLIDIQMDSSAETSRIKEATIAVQLYIHRYFVNLEKIKLDSDDQPATREALKERWQWLRNYRVWEANRKVFLYPENYIRPELRDTVSPAFKELQENLAQGELTDDLVKESYLKYMDNYTEVSELAIAGGYVYDDTGKGRNDKVMTLFGRTRTAPYRYFYRFATFVGGNSQAINWKPWLELDIQIPSQNVEPVYAFNRMFVFWADVEEVISDPDSGKVEMKENGDRFSVSSANNLQYRIKVYYSFYNLNKRWSPPQLLQVENSNSLLYDRKISVKDVKLFIKNDTTSPEDSKISITVRHQYDYSIGNIEHYLKIVDQYTSQHSNIEYYIERLKKIIGESKSSNSTKLEADRLEDFYHNAKRLQEEINRTCSCLPSSYKSYPNELIIASKGEYNTFHLMPELYSKEASPVKMNNPGTKLFEDFFPEAGSTTENNSIMLSALDSSSDSRWFAYNHKGSSFLVKPDTVPMADNSWQKPNDQNTMPDPESITAAVQVGDTLYFFLNNQTYRVLSNNGKTLSAPKSIKDKWGGTMSSQIPDTSFTNSREEIFTFDDATGTVSRRYMKDPGTGISSDIRSTFGLPALTTGPVEKMSTALVFNDTLHVIQDNTYKTYTAKGRSDQPDTNMQTVANKLFGKNITGLKGAEEAVTGMMMVDGGVWLRSANNLNFIHKSGQVGGVGGSPETMENLAVYWDPASSSDGNSIRKTVTDCPISNGGAMQVLSLDGNSSYEIPNSTSSGKVKSFTLEIWVKLTKTESDYAYLMSKGDISLYLDAEGCLRFNNGKEDEDAENTSLYDDKWHHIAAVYNDKNKKNEIYIDNELVGEFKGKTTENGLGTDPLIIGMDPGHKKYFAKGQIAEVRIWDTARTESEITENRELRLIDQTASVPEPYNDNSADWQSGLHYSNGSITHHIAFYAENQAKAWTDKVPVNFSDGDTFDHAVNVTAAFTSSNGKNVIIVTDSDNYHLFDHTQTPEDILAQLKAGTNQGVLKYLEQGVYLGDTMQDSPIWSKNSVDAAFIGANGWGTENSLYLFSDDQYYRYTPTDDGEFLNTPDAGYPKLIKKNGEGFPQNWDQVDAAYTAVDGVSYLFNGKNYFRHDSDILFTIDDEDLSVTTDLMKNQIVDSAFCTDNHLYLIAGKEYYRYTLISSEKGKRVPDFVDKGYPKAMPESLPDGKTVDAVFKLKGAYYFISGNKYKCLNVGKDSIDFTQLKNFELIFGNWGNLPADIRNNGLNAAYNATWNSGETLTLIQGQNYISYNLSDNSATPYEKANVKYELIRLTSSTAEELNQILFAGDIDDLLKMPTQEINESPTISFAGTSSKNIAMNSNRFTVEPTNSHLDFNSANGLYYWEIFFHVPFLIAQTLNADQKFEEAQKWYEKIYDPTAVADYWKFLPFLAADPEALMATLGNDLDNFGAISGSNMNAAYEAQKELIDRLAPYREVFLGKVNKAVYEKNRSDADKLENIQDWPAYRAMLEAVNNLQIPPNAGKNESQLKTWQSEMREVLEIIRKLDFRIDLMNNYTSQLATYLEDPFDPHAIAALRPLSYRKAIVMRYVDNLLDWGDMLFRQYSRESINEARMLYILAYDLLGEKPRNMGSVVLENTKSYDELKNQMDNSGYDFLIHMENSGINTDYESNLSFAATQYDTVTRPYFFLKENDLFTEYWNRVEDRLGKIRACLNIDGIAQPLPLFQPPIDPMALVNAVAGGGDIQSAAATAGGAAAVPNHRFEMLINKARELAGKLTGFGDNLLSTLEKKDSEELSLLQGKQESMMLELMTQSKQYQIKEAEITLKNLESSKKRAEEQLSHYENLIDKGYLSEEETQIGMMTASAAINGTVGLGHLASGISFALPQFTIGAFSFGSTAGGTNIGAMLDKFAEATQSASEAISMGGEVAGIKAQFKRTKEDWELQKTISTFEVEQLGHEIEAQKERIKMSQHDLILHEQDIEQKKAINTFMKNKFSNLQLYSWMSGKISGLFFQTYKMAHDYAKQAEQAFIFEKGLKTSEVNYINGMYWDSSKKGILSGSTLDLDLDRMEQAYMETDSRRMEITKNISLLEIDPLALLQLKTKGSCNFRLSEELFDYDFPGHYNRQIKSISLAFDIGEGQTVNATLTQLNSNMVMAPDIKAVKHLLDPTNEANTNVRVNWRPNQQVALSHVDEYSENNGMFELNFHDARYLPFEGTGAVSNWHLELGGKKGSYNPADLLNVTVKLRYTAQQGGQRFANEVKGLLKPYHATSFFDMAYNFPDEWTAMTQGDNQEMTIRFTRDMFPNMSSGKIVGMLIRYQHTDGDSGSFFTINDDLKVPDATYLQPATLNIGQTGSEWKFTLKGDPSTLKNAEMVLVYKAEV